MRLLALFCLGEFMAQYDGSIRINTSIEMKKAQIQLSTLENRIVKTSDKIASLRSKMDALKEAKIPTQEYKSIESDIAKAETELGKLIEKQAQMQNEGKNSGAAWNTLNQKIQASKDYIETAKEEMQELVNAGKAFTLGRDTDEFAKMGQNLKYLENDYDVLLQKEDALREKIRQSTSGYKNFGDVAKKSFSAVGSLLKKADSAVDSFRKKIKEIAQKHLPLFRKETEKTGASVSTFGSRIKSIFSGIFIFNAISAAVRKTLSGIREGFENFYNTSNNFKASVDGMRSSLAQLKNALAGAFSPIVETAIPYIQRLINYINKAVSGIAQLIAALFGKKTYKKAKQVSIGGGTADTGKDKKKVEQVEDSVNDLKDSAEDAEDAMNKMLSPLDKLNNLSSEKKEIQVDTGNIGDAGENIADDITDGIGEGLEDIFEDIPIDKFWSDIADKVKDVFSKLFAPLKEAWNREGKFVMDSWKYALDEVWKLIKDVGRDFLIMWQQEATIKIFEDILHIIGDIGLAVGNLAQNFRAAWNENSVGLHIFENIRDIIGIIIGHIRNMADATVEWAQNIDFYPLLSAFNGFLESLEPVVDSISGILEDFYTKVLLPLGKWVLEKGLPELLQVFTDFNNKVDWESLRANLAEFWEHLEPFAETVGEGLIIFIEKVSDALANFINSQGFKDFLASVENWMDSVSPEDVADALVKIADALIGLKVALLGYEAIKGIKGVFDAVKGFLAFFGAGGTGIAVAKNIEKTSTAIGALGSALFDFGVSTAAATAAGNVMIDKMLEVAESNGVAAQAIQNTEEQYGGWIGPIKLVKDELHGLLLGMEGIPVTVASTVGAADGLGKAMEEIANGTIYTDKQLEKMQKTWGLTSDDVEMLRQEMLDANPLLREFADNLNLEDASAETLQDIAEGFASLSRGIDPVSDGFTVMTGEARDFLGAVTEGATPISSYTEALKGIGEAAENANGSLNHVGEQISAGITKGIEESNVEGETVGFFGGIIEGIKNLFQIHSPSAVMEQIGIYIVEGLLNGINSALDSVKEVWASVKETAVNTWESVKTTFQEIWDSIKNTAATSWNGIKATLSGVWNGMKTTVISVFNSVKTSLSNTWNGIKATVMSVWDSISSKVTAVVNNIRGKIEGFIGNVKKAIQAVKDFLSSGFEKIGNTVGGGFSGNSGKTGSSTAYSTRSVPSLYAANPAIAALSNAEIPGYATGQVIPRTMRQHLAVLGDNNRETEVVSPLSTIEQAVVNAMAKVNGSIGNNGGGSVTIEIPVTISGIGEIGRAVQQFDMEFFKQNGRHAFT